MLTKRFDERTSIQNGLSVIYEPLGSNVKGSNIKVATKQGKVYKEEIALLILQIKYQLMLKSEEYDENDPTLKSIKSKMIDYYKRHCSRTKKAGQKYIDILQAEILEEEKKDETNEYRVNGLKEKKERIEKRIENGKVDPSQVTKDCDKIARRRFIKIPGLTTSYDNATTLECITILQAYQELYQAIDTTSIPENNRLYVKTITGESTKYSKLKVGEKVTEKTAEERREK